jgi:hypothetical protein
MAKAGQFTKGGGRSIKRPGGKGGVVHVGGKKK